MEGEAKIWSFPPHDHRCQCQTEFYFDLSAGLVVTLIGSMSPWVLPDRTQGTFRQYPGRHRPYHFKKVSAVVTYGLKCHICRICGDGPWCSHIRRKKGKLCFHYCTVHGNFRQLTLTFAGNNANGSVRRRTQSHSHCHTVTVTSRWNSLNMLLTFTASSKSTHSSLTVLATILYYGVFYLLLEKYNTIQSINTQETVMFTLG